MSVLLLLLIAFVVSHAAFVIDKVQPVIGVLSIPPSAQSDQLGLNISMIDTSYSKYLWGAGAVVVPIFFHQSEDEIKQQGLLIPEAEARFLNYIGKARMHSPLEALAQIHLHLNVPHRETRTERFIE